MNACFECALLITLTNELIVERSTLLSITFCEFLSVEMDARMRNGHYGILSGKSLGLSMQSDAQREEHFPFGRLSADQLGEIMSGQCFTSGRYARSLHRQIDNEDSGHSNRLSCWADKSSVPIYLLNELAMNKSIPVQAPAV